MNPTIGRIVIYRAIDQDCAAIVTAVANDDHVSLTVFPPNGNSYPVVNVAFDDEPQAGVTIAQRPGTWRWPVIER